MLNGLLSAVANLFVQIVFTAGIIGLCGMFISFCNRCFYDCLGDTAFFIVRASGAIGTPVHELSHALMCVIFGHRITKIQIYNTKKKAKVLGFVEHTYNRRNLYNLMGNFFIGIAPIVVGGLVVTLFVALLTPEMYNDMIGEFDAMSSAASSGYLSQLVIGAGRLIAAVFSPENVLRWQWWICIILSFAISIHMEISRSDIKGGLKGLGVIALFLTVLDLVLAFLFPNALKAVTSAFVNTGLFMTAFLTIPAVFSGTVLLISGIVALIKALNQSIKNSKK